MEKIELSNYHKYKETHDNWRRLNQAKINLYYREQRRLIKEIKTEAAKKQIALEYLNNLIKK